MTENTMRPVYKIRYGNVSAAVWANNSQAGYFYNTTFCRVYKEADVWGESTSFEDRDLPNLAKAASGRPYLDLPAKSTGGDGRRY